MVSTGSQVLIICLLIEQVDWLVMRSRDCSWLAQRRHVTQAGDKDGGATERETRRSKGRELWRGSWRRERGRERWDDGVRRSRRRGRRVCGSRTLFLLFHKGIIRAAQDQVFLTLLLCFLKREVASSVVTSSLHGVRLSIYRFPSHLRQESNDKEIRTWTLKNIYYALKDLLLRY